ncbi:MAG: hypothetical protein CMJ83_12195 [Planctomycetes bacterium]|nr:hypothetical protein [Planctomycetota bacterium]
MLEEHRELQKLVTDLRTFLKRPRPKLGDGGAHTWATSLAADLVTLHDRVFRHFREEERSGVLDDLCALHPRAARAVMLLKDEHEEILTGFRTILRSVMTYSESKTPEIPHLRRRTWSILEQLLCHECKETDLFQRFIYEDLGTCD